MDCQGGMSAKVTRIDEGDGMKEDGRTAYEQN